MSETARAMTEDEIDDYERITREMHAEARRILSGRPRKCATLSPKQAKDIE